MMESGKMNYWLFKTEPSECSIDDFARNPQQPIVWEGVRNYQARNYLRDGVALGDQVLIYHSSCKHLGVAGIVKVVRAAYADPSQFDSRSVYYDAKATVAQPTWVAVDLVYVSKLSHLITLDKIKSSAKMAELPLVQKGSRLSVMPVTAQQWCDLLALQ
jgi:predicted RNA-binding protein with PUA-like domain